MIKKLKSIIWMQLAVVVLRYQIGATFVFASLIKIKGNRFTGDSGLDHPIDSAWHFFETLYASGIYWKFIGFAQLIAGGLLMTQRFSRLGAIFFFPIILNVFVITISYDFNYTPVITGLMLLASAGLLLWEWPQLKVVVGFTPEEEVKGMLESLPVWRFTGLVLFLFTAGYRALYNQYDIFLWGGVCLSIGLIGLVVGLMQYRRSRNGLMT